MKALYSVVIFLIAAPAVASLTPFRVVIDPGHGGQDQGARFGEVTEKQITLALAKQVANHLRARGITTFLTRSGDDEVPLSSRTAMANKLKADLFLSIHMNSSPTPGSGGIETYILNNATDATSKRLAHFENVGLSVNSEPPAEGTDVALILQDLRLDANLSESKRLACAVQDNLVSAALRAAPASRAPTHYTSAHSHNRGVKQALFYVLLGANMPSVLVEAGFLNNPRDRTLVLSPSGQAQISSAIAQAVDSYRRSKGTPTARLALSRCQVR